eukprot:TRINITY_DN6236_c1_g1_i1.p1 TRINITY_DN6236_c1_g1~~TRINITY_DN6236_c1_g1_i1.p1  ORF type:complete len:764 (-),score=141.71 TRINITY_DN6236_c1_g1_i1:81-2372(-)
MEDSSFEQSVRQTAQLADTCYDEFSGQCEEWDSNIATIFEEFHSVLTSRESRMLSELADCTSLNKKNIAILSSDVAAKKEAIDRRLFMARLRTKQRPPLIHLAKLWQSLKQHHDLQSGSYQKGRYICHSISKEQERYPLNGESSMGRVYLGAYAITRMISATELVDSTSLRHNTSLAFSSPKSLSIHPITKEIFVANSGVGDICVLTPELSFKRTIHFNWSIELLMTAPRQRGNSLLDGMQKFASLLGFGSSAVDKSPLPESRIDARFCPIALSHSRDGEYLAVVDDAKWFVLLFDKGDRCIREIGGRGTKAHQLLQPKAVAFDRENCIYVADSGNNCVKKFSLRGGLMNKIGLGRSCVYDGPVTGVNVSQDDNVYVVVKDSSDLFVHSTTGTLLRKIAIDSMSNAQIGFFGNESFFLFDMYRRVDFYDLDGNFRKRLSIKMPGGVVVDDHNRLITSNYITDHVSSYSIDWAARSLEFLKNSTALTADSQFPVVNITGFAIHPATQNLYISDTKSKCVMVLSPTFVPLLHIGEKQGDESQNAALTDDPYYVSDTRVYFRNPTVLAFSTAGDRLAVVDSSARIIFIFDSSGTLKSKINDTDFYSSVRVRPEMVVFDHEDYLYVAESGGNYIRKYSIDGHTIGTIDLKMPPAQNCYTCPMMVNDQNEIVVIVRSENHVRFYNAQTLELIRTLDLQLQSVSCLARGPYGGYAVCGTRKNMENVACIHFFAEDGNYISDIRVTSPVGVAFDCHGRLFIARERGLLEY